MEISPSYLQNEMKCTKFVLTLNATKVRFKVSLCILRTARGPTNTFLTDLTQQRTPVLLQNATSQREGEKGFCVVSDWEMVHSP